MKRILFSLIFLFVSSAGTIEPDSFSTPSTPTEKAESIFHQIASGALYLGVGTAFMSVSLLAKLGWASSFISPWNTSIGQECLVLSHLTRSAARVVYSQIGKSSSAIPYSSWENNRTILSQIPVSSEKEKELISFLQRRYLAKCAGFFPIIVKRICPIFGISVQAHPETQSAYARDPRRTMLGTYKKRMEAWKQILPQPHSYPLLLTRPASLQNYFPNYFTISNEKDVQAVIKNANSETVVDLTDILTQSSEDEWLKSWKDFQRHFPKSSHEHILCVQRVQEGGLGGIRLLPFTNQSPKATEKRYRYLLEWISFFGLTANRIELDRFFLPSDTSLSPTLPFSVEFQSKEELISCLEVFRKKWKSNHPQKELMVKGTLQVLTGLFREISDDNWKAVMSSPTLSLIAQVSFQKIEQQLEQLIQDNENVRFFDTAGSVEQIHADLTALLEIFCPFKTEDFPPIYQELLTTIPNSLKPLTSLSIHASGMTSLAGVLQAIEKSSGAPPRILFGENTYYECIMIGDHVSHCVPIEEATADDWKHVDLILAQFNPALKRTHLVPTEYKIEQIADMLRSTLKLRNGKPLTLALDCTIDYIDSPRVGKLLETFQKEIAAGILNIVCYRSGLKFDLFGMDNYCGAPFYMIHNEAAHWEPFNALLTDPALVTDSLSINWFCLAYKNAAPYLESYRKHIFENTRNLLDKIPPRLFEESSPYRVVSVDQETDLCFIDVKVSGPMHILRGSSLAGGLLYLKCMERGIPIFYRRSIGFYHSNFAMLFCKENATIRLTLGIDSDEVNLFSKTFEIMDTMNGPSKRVFHPKRQNGI